MTIRELKPEQLRARCSADKMSFTSTEQVKELKGSIGQERAIRAMQFGLSNKMKGFNIFILGDPGAGKTSTLRNILIGKAKQEPKPPDWIYVHNFDDENRPLAYRMPAGSGQQFKKDMATFVSELKRIIPKLQEGEGYLQLGQRIEDNYRKREEAALAKLQRIGKKNELHIEQVSGELLIQVVRDGHTLDHEEFEQLTNEERRYYEEKVRSIHEDIGEFLRVQRRLEREKQEKVQKLDHDQILNHTEELVAELKKRYQKVDGVSGWLHQMWQYIPDAFRDYQLAQEALESPMEMPSMPPSLPDFQQFQVNLLVNNKDTVGAPVVFENTPTYHNLLGCVEYQEHYGVLSTDLTLVRAGALHRANGGYLVIQVNDLMKSMYAWDALKKSLRNKEVLIDELDIEARTRSTVSPKPAAIPLQVKVILIGNYDAYYFLLNYDEDFSRLFKVKAEFDDVVPRTRSNIAKYAGFISRLVREDNLLPFHATAIAKIIEQCSRIAEHQNKMSARFIHLINLVSEANYWADSEGARQVKGSHVSMAIKERKCRMGKIEADVYDQIREGTVLIDTRKKVVGQINGIAVYDMGDHAFGIPSRITAQTYAGRQGILNIDREADLAGKIHNKAALILIGIIGNLYAQKRPLSLSASIGFEQMYGEVDGDSASCAELFALLSSLSNVPVDQGICVTGSLNQKGEVQPIGGVNEKIEGVYHICKAKGLTGKQGVVIPQKNKVNLMLDEEVVEAVEKGKFHVWTIRNINEGIHIMLGESPAKIHQLVRKRLGQLHSALAEE